MKKVMIYLLAMVPALSVAFLGHTESDQRAGCSELCSPDRVAVQRLPLHTAGTQPRRAKIQAARLRR